MKFPSPTPSDYMRAVQRNAVLAEALEADPDYRAATDRLARFLADADALPDPVIPTRPSGHPGTWHPADEVVFAAIVTARAGRRVGTKLQADLTPIAAAATIAGVMCSAFARIAGALQGDVDEAARRADPFPHIRQVVTETVAAYRANPDDTDAARRHTAARDAQRHATQSALGIDWKEPSPIHEHWHHVAYIDAAPLWGSDHNMAHGIAYGFHKVPDPSIRQNRREELPHPYPPGGASPADWLDWMVAHPDVPAEVPDPDEAQARADHVAELVFRALGGVRSIRQPGREFADIIRAEPI